ncbi:Y+L amino acid transporter 2-like [Anopheles albimanus]|uniref:Amino acid permease/ SLC12A domain-containing protein n=1 Tax=Anopheles albimanus TaxID=7167 RepID=A0A182F8M5_ANOAL|nr:Y+L amino acid transporter 2-like [Anopheles albimanus]XP_035796240.1 Y+L amino acid transporter 2-like [Anopheles albimanus]XP_035796241.1 Y+L amino acid transporter 2-like [Anopheles albimanus]
MPLKHRPAVLELHSPTEDNLVSPSNGSVATEFGSVTGEPSSMVAPTDAGPSSSSSDDRVKMKKSLGLLEGVAIILGIIFGSGIFISPKGVLQEVGSVGTSLVIWVLCGVLSMIGALCYAELGTAIPKSGGDYAYIYEAYGPLPAFLYLWDATVIFVPSTNAIMGLTFASYVFQPLFAAGCSVPTIGLQLFAAVTICALTYINAYDVRVTTKMQNVFMFTKIGALVLVILVGIGWMALAEGGMDNFENAFEGTETDPGKLSVAFYSGIFSYAGWNYLNFMTEELRDPYKNLPRAIYISLPLVTAIYVLANMAYVAVLTPQAILSSDAIAVTFAQRAMSYGSFVMPILVAVAAFGGLSVHIMTSSRMCFVGARNGHMPEILSHINVNRFTPMPSLVFLCLLSLLYLFISDVYVLITYSSIVETFFIMLSVSAVLYFRYTRPDIHRPIRVPLWVPTFFVIICVFLLIVPCYVAPYEVGMGVALTLAGIPVYYIGVAWKTKPKAFTDALTAVTQFCQKMFMTAKEEPENADE